MWLIKAALRNPYMVAVLALMILVLGTMAIASIPVDILPVFKAPAVQVLTYFQGMPAPSVEKTITNRIERWVNQSPGCRLVESKSVPGVSVVKLYFREDIDPNAALTMTTSLAQGTLPTLPPNTLPPVTLPFDPTGTMPLGILTVNNPRLNEANIKDTARIDVRNMLGSIRGAVAPVVVGGKDRTILVYLDPQKMWTRKVSPIDVVAALRKGNLMVTPGTAYFGDHQLLLDTNVMVTDVEELNRLPIRMLPGQNVFLEDVGRAEDSYAIQTSRVRIDGKPQVYVPVYRQGGASSLAVSHSVIANLKDMEGRLPEGTKLAYVMDQSGYVEEAILSLIHEGIIGAALVSVMILIFLGNWRMTVIATMSIPLALLAAIFGLYATGNTINAMSLGGLALAIGPLVDDAIVVLENTHRHRSLGKSPIRSAFDGAHEVTIPVLVATTTTIIVLCPIALMPGMGGFLFRPLTLAVAFAMIASFVLSRTFVPMMCYKFMPDEHHHAPGEHEGPPAGGWFARAHHRIDHFLIHLTGRYERILHWALRRRLLVLTGVGLLFVASLGLTFGIGREFFPQVDAGQITMAVRAPSRYNLDATTAKIAQVEKFLETYIPAQEREMIVSEIGLDPDWSAAYSDNSGQQDTVIRIQLKEDRTLTSQEYAVKIRHLLHSAAANWPGFCRSQPETARFQLLRDFRKPLDDPAFAALRREPRYRELLQEKEFDRLAQLPPERALRTSPRLRELLADRRFGKLLADPRFEELEVSFNTGGMVSTALNYGKSSPIDVQILGGQEAAAMKYAQLLRGRIKKVRGAADVRIVQRLDAPYLILQVDRLKAAQLGLSASDVIQQVVAALNSSVSINRNFWIDLKTGNQYFVAVQYPEDRSRSIEDTLNRVYANSPTNSSDVPLSSLLVQPLQYTHKAAEINHVNLARVFNLLVNTENRDIAGVAADIEKVLDQTPRPPKVKVRLRGEYARMNDSFADLGYGLILASILVYLLLVGLFRSWLGPFMIMFTVPLGLIGVLGMLFLTRTTLNVQSELGVIFLVGIVVSNGVLLVDFANRQRKQGATVYQAITAAGAIRFRPILMTFLATFLDLVPMAIGMGKGSEANVPLARAVVGGLLTSTFLTLVIIPILYTWVYKDGGSQEVDIDEELARPVAPAPAVLAYDEGVISPAAAEAGAEPVPLPEDVPADGLRADETRRPRGSPPG